MCFLFLFHYSEYLVTVVNPQSLRLNFFLLKHTLPPFALHRGWFYPSMETEVLLHNLMCLVDYTPVSESIRHKTEQVFEGMIHCGKGLNVADIQSFCSKMKSLFFFSLLASLEGD
ncbi:PREDICTED: protein-S-isoprenylcysteine O-methyltransferase [Thamnophis sirtalis]|uniref:Protein-S-isoprenylcysteine O-methyltransferase n=1 Tax=Thamnophis sirtalis TaxID=35019 RepID=A0A6I9Y3S5_9SAUR|nr:PREDICTED: protein-S-isoprenylcysteine O-methyltransferase [Thamnophis sirtalis]